MSAVNKDEALRCLDLSRAAFAAGNVEKAYRMAEKSFRLFPTDEAKLLLQTIRRTPAADSMPSQSTDSAHHPSVNGMHHRSTASSRNATSQEQDDRSAQGATGKPAMCAVWCTGRQQHDQLGTPQQMSCMCERKPDDSPTNAPLDTEATPEQQELVARIQRTKCYYEILAISKEATDDDIKKAYRKLALKLHPDKNCATGADEAFKAVSRAFATLSDPEKRRHYDQYGTEDPQHLRRTPSHPHGFEEVDPEMLFNMFFGGSPFPGGGRYVYRQYGGGQRRGAQQQQASQFAQLLSLLPVLLLFLVMTFNNMSNEPVYSLVTDDMYQIKQVTQQYKVPFYIRNQQKYDREYPPDSNKRLRIERDVEAAYRERIQQMCHNERLQKQRLARWGYAEQAKDLPLTACDELWERFRQKPQGFYYM